MARNSWSSIQNITAGSGSGKTNSLSNLINQEADIDKIYLYAKDLNEAIYQILLNTQMIWLIFKKILKNTIQIKNGKYWLFLMIWLVICLIIKSLINSNWIIYWR